MNETSTINKFIVDQFDANALVNTISRVKTGLIDLNKENIYPLVNVDMLSFNTEDDVLSYNFRITIVQQRDIQPRKTDSKLLDDTNYLDNMNETSSIAQRFINVLTRQNNDENIEIVSQSDADFLDNWRGSGLDGVQFTIELAIPNKDTSC
jgi:hypothetical protein